MSWDFGGKTALVTGGAGGIGEAIVRKLAAAGAAVVFTDLVKPASQALEEELRGSGADVRFILADVTQEDQVRALVGAALGVSGRLDMAINTVGGISREKGDHSSKRIHDTDLSSWRATQDFNLTSCFLSMKYEIPPMMAQGKGAIVNLTSLAGMRFSDKSSPAYASAKAGVIHLTRYAAAAYAEAGVRVNVVAPGLTATPILLAQMPDVEARNARAKGKIPMGRMIDPGETADACVWACSDFASAVTGLTIPVDGGQAAL